MINIEEIVSSLQSVYVPGTIKKYWIFNETWGSTALGFDGYAGCDVMTDAPTIVIISKYEGKKWARVYFRGIFAYKFKVDSIETYNKLLEDINDNCMPSVNAAKLRYNIE